MVHVYFHSPLFAYFLMDFQYVWINIMEICYFTKKLNLLWIVLNNLNSMK